jgi:hypothetical protein
VDARQLHKDAIRAQPLDGRLGDAKRVDAPPQYLEALVNHGAAAPDHRGFGRT